MRMKLITGIIFLSAIILNSCNRDNHISGTYISKSVMVPQVKGCCSSTEILQLNKDHTFTVFGQDDQGDYLVKNFASGTYNPQHDMISFQPDSIDKRYDYSMVKFKVPTSDNPVKFLFKQDHEPQKFYKIDFKKADSLSIERYNVHDWDQERITIKKDGNVHYTRNTQDKNKNPMEISKHKKLTREQFQEYIDTLSKSRLFQPKTTSKKYIITFSLTFNEYHMQIHDQDNVDQKLYNFFFEKVCKWVQ